eukprot:UN05464
MIINGTLCVLGRLQRQAERIGRGPNNGDVFSYMRELWPTMVGRYEFRIKAFIYDAIDAKTGESLGWPPIHRHHIHLYDASGGTDNIRVFARHGDDECIESEVSPGIACFLYRSTRRLRLSMARKKEIWNLNITIP